MNTQAEYRDFLERQFTEMRDQLHALKQVLKPAIEAAQSRIGANVQNKDDEALLEAGRILGVSYAD